MISFFTCCQRAASQVCPKEGFGSDPIPTIIVLDCTDAAYDIPLPTSLGSDRHLFQPSARSSRSGYDAGSASPSTPTTSMMGDLSPTPASPTFGTPRSIPTPCELSYEGQYFGTMKHGMGTLRMQGCTYKGQFKDDLKNGIGTHEWDDGRIYEGQFEDGVFHGLGVMSWPDHRLYWGQYSKGRKEGRGTFSWADGRRYEGQWMAGKRHGEGAYTNARGHTRVGTFSEDRPVHWHSSSKDKDGPLSQKRPALQRAQRSDRDVDHARKMREELIVGDSDAENNNVDNQDLTGSDADGWQRSELEDWSSGRLPNFGVQSEKFRVGEQMQPDIGDPFRAGVPPTDLPRLGLHGLRHQEGSSRPSVNVMIKGHEFEACRDSDHGPSAFA